MNATIETLDEIKPGKTYPSYVKVVEKDKTFVEFRLNSFFVGMYCAIYINERTMPIQTGDHNNKRFCAKLKRDLKSAFARGATVEISSIRDCKLEMTA